VVLHAVYSSPNTIRIIILKTVRQVRYAAHTRQVTNAYKTIIRKPEHKTADRTKLNWILRNWVQIFGLKSPG